MARSSGPIWNRFMYHTKAAGTASEYAFSKQAHKAISRNKRARYIGFRVY